MQYHGGDIYRNRDISIDLSINTNPLGVPPKVAEAAREALELLGQYPDPAKEELKKKIAEAYVCQPEEVLVGNGASELFLDIVYTFLPKTIGIAVPSFGGYRYAARAVGARLEAYQLKEKKSYIVDEKILELIERGIDLLILATPNNPTGATIPIPLLDKILKHCQRKGILVVIDECFMELCDQVDDYEDFFFKSSFDNVIRVSAFTKSYALAGARLGFARTVRKLAERIATHQSEWNVSILSERCGIAALSERDYLERSRSFLRGERNFIMSALMGMGFTVFPGEANFVMIKSQIPLYEKLLEKGILIRDLRDFDGLSGQCYRLAIKDRPTNIRLLSALQEVVNGR